MKKRILGVLVALLTVSPFCFAQNTTAYTTSDSCLSACREQGYDGAGCEWPGHFSKESFERFNAHEKEFYEQNKEKIITWKKEVEANPELAHKYPYSQFIQFFDGSFATREYPYSEVKDLGECCIKNTKHILLPV